MNAPVNRSAPTVTTFIRRRRIAQSAWGREEVDIWSGSAEARSSCIRRVRAWRACLYATLAEPVCRDIASNSAACYSRRKADGLHDNGSASMKKVELAERLAARMGMNKAAAKDAVDGVFEAIGLALANGEEARILGFGTFGSG